MTYHKSRSSGLAILLAITSSIHPALAQNNTTTTKQDFSCTTLNPTFTSDNRAQNWNYTILSNTTSRVTAARICETQDTCVIQTGYNTIENVEPTTNLSSISKPAALKRVIHRVLDASGINEVEEWPIRFSSETYAINETHPDNAKSPYSIKRGEAGYVAFTPQMDCYNGILATLPNCEAGDDARRTAEQFNGTAIQICVPRVLRLRSGKNRSRYTEFRPVGIAKVAKITPGEARSNDSWAVDPQSGTRYNLTTGQILTDQAHNVPLPKPGAAGRVGVSLGWMGLVAVVVGSVL